MEALIAIALIIALVFAVYAGFWWLWCWVMPQLWPTGPENIIQPGFWLFVACLFIFSWLGRMIFGGRQAKE